ncbi:copper homeostasis protein CutC [Paracoccus sp. (in: a-proteobacteria)]|uniref:copper homeostasis protein CutC n=1 Tax=Paracoccus sp. TaxID=267 RepID=UPI003A8ABA7A
MMTRITLEVCVDDTAGIAAAAKGGADRLELCAALALGGLTPSTGLMRLAAESRVPTLAMIRPRSGDFVWIRRERAAMRAEIAAARAERLAGVVIGANLPDGRLDAETLSDLMAEAEGMGIALHRAIDLTPDVSEALSLCRELGIRRVLSSGGAATAVEGIDRLAQMQGQGVTIMPGSGVSADNVAQLDARLRLTEVHASCSGPLPVPGDPKVRGFGFQPAGARGTDAARVAGMRALLDQITASRPAG